jgi:hypothetical protein
MITAASNVIPIFGRGYVEIHGGVVSSTTVTDSNGKHSIAAHVGHHRFFVEIIEPDGGRLGIWDGASYEQAILEAGIAGREDAIPVRNLVILPRMGGE